MSSRSYIQAVAPREPELTPAAVMPLVGVAESGRHALSPLQEDGPCTSGCGNSWLYASDEPVQSGALRTSSGGEALRNPPAIGIKAWRARTVATLDEFWATAKAHLAPMSVLDWTAYKEPMTPLGPKVWPKADDNNAPHFDYGHDSAHPNKLILPARPPRKPLPGSSRWVPAVLVVPEPNGGEFQFDIMYRPALPVWLENFDPEALYSTEEVWGDGDNGFWDNGIHRTAWVLKKGAFVQETEWRIIPAAIAVVGDQPSLVSAVKTMAEYWGLSGDWSEWFPAAIGAMTIRLTNSSELETLKEVYPLAPLDKAQVGAGVLPRPAKLPPGDYLPVTLSHDSVCGMCPAYLEPTDDAADPGLVRLSGEGWGTDTGITQSMTASAVIDGVAYDQDGNEIVNDGDGPPAPKEGPPWGVLAAVGVGVAAFLMTRRK